MFPRNLLPLRQPGDNLTRVGFGWRRLEPRCGGRQRKCATQPQTNPTDMTPPSSRAAAHGGYKPGMRL